MRLVFVLLPLYVVSARPVANPTSDSMEVNSPDTEAKEPGFAPNEADFGNEDFDKAGEDLIPETNDFIETSEIPNDNEIGDPTFSNSRSSDETKYSNETSDELDELKRGSSLTLMAGLTQKLIGNVDKLASLTGTPLDQLISFPEKNSIQNSKRENMEGENMEGENMQGENMKGENMQGENMKGENMQGENMEGEKEKEEEGSWQDLVQNVIGTLDVTALGLEGVSAKTSPEEVTRLTKSLKMYLVSKDTE